MLWIDCQETTEIQLPCFPIFPAGRGAFIDHVVAELIAFACQDKEQQQKQLIKEVQISDFIVRGQDQVAKLHCFLLPGSTEHLICIRTYSKLIGYGKDAMVTVVG